MASSGAEFTGNGDTQQMLNTFWDRQLNEIRGLTPNDFKAQELPLARIKKIMKLDEDVKMISAEAPVLFAKAAEIFVSELTLRAWIYTEDNKRRTLQKNDIAMAVTKYDQMDFLIDIVPRDELKPTRKSEESVQSTSMRADQVQYYFQLAQQHQASLQQQQQPATVTTTTAAAAQPPVQHIQLQGGQLVAGGGQQPLQIQVGGNTVQGSTLQVTQAQGGGDAAGQLQTQVIQLQAPSQPAPTTTPTIAQPQQDQSAQHVTTQVFQQIITPTGEVQNVPIQLTPAQIQALTLQMQGKQPGQSIIIQTQGVQGEETQQQQQLQLTQSQANDITPPLFQLPLSSVGGQQVYIQQSEGDDSQITELQT